MECELGNGRHLCIVLLRPPSHFALWATRDKSADYGGQRLFGLALRPIPKNELGGCPASLRYAVASGFEATIAA
ncbi:hypothetical protein A2424_05100 [Candidatus Peribacteria bacterium RIFOXYC1_FULL_54_13]|nr:MAG: hypothetical protein A2198_06510 [Candidatus Peribacteria bacterium RIFOXYA1_FULL_56_14]OGJ73473.1 MAG: hypothetical protein A2217_02065 [Candidatus Peribacteria bacterium RIFOXYA2_FULL_55_28]OGJ74654.1 MAG: hypothetical protein A2384_03350 [Candidatus Peribacteria bacterium RIFOXYB1_FULL_54_35]OGJ78038.1 MAG: hypothetical protein A2424_05100 [Candidatus Peribacteria bacterium RIFOXYC1_FULL_54_13]OGJ83600.1 MAG: hypothetical protein A2598_03395 [Candidatus Peribacteria bacterium RIFOXYD